MPDENNPETIWRNQPMDAIAVNFERLVSRRAREFESATRLEILGSLGAALFAVAVMLSQFGAARGSIFQIILGVIVLWVVITVYRFREQIWPKPFAPGNIASTGIAHYRSVLERRQAHMKNAWVWHGPLILALLVLFGTLAQVVIPNTQRLGNMLPLTLLLLLWIALGVFMRHNKSAEIQRELDELENPSTHR